LQKHQDTKFASGSDSEKANIFIPFNNKSKVTKATRSHILDIALTDVFIFFDFNVHTSIIEVENI